MKINNYIKIFPALLLLVLLVLATSCDSFLDENDVSGKYTDDVVWASPTFAEGVMLGAYKALPTDFNYTSDYVTSDMVTNDLAANTRVMGMGGWTDQANPLDEYATVYNVLLQLNDFLAHVDQVDFAPLSEQAVKDEYRKKLKAEAYALRAWWGDELLKTCGGETADGKLLGYPIVNQIISDVEAAKLPRNTYADCVAQILSDCDEALKSLPLRWMDHATDVDYNRIYGVRNMNRINGLAIELLKSRLLLRAASPSFAASGVSWTQAANAAAKVMADNGGLSGLNANDVTFYDKGYDVAALNTSTELIWYCQLTQSDKARETRNYPPSLFGTGRVNPSQNLVNSFPAANGYPIDQAQSNYNSSAPYANRDSRMGKYIVLNGSKIGKTTIVTTSSDDAIGATVNSTRTGYYVRKFLNESVDLTPGKIIQAPSYFVNARYTEALLNFAEAANEAVGPDQDISGFSARQVINAIRTRAGITTLTYANSCNQEDMRELIKNERRIELCFEGFRFWDLRRWNDLAAMNTGVVGFDAKTNLNFDIEPRIYQDYMIYAPIPYNEKVIGLTQNKGW